MIKAVCVGGFCTAEYKSAVWYLMTLLDRSGAIEFKSKYVNSNNDEYFLLEVKEEQAAEMLSVFNTSDAIPSEDFPNLDAAVEEMESRFCERVDKL